MDDEDLVFHAVIKGVLLNQQVQTGWHLYHVDPTSSPAELAGDIQTNIIPALVAATSSAVQWNSIRIDSVSKDGQEGLEVAVTSTPPGAISGDALPPFCSALISSKTGFKSRRRRGRLFVPGLAESGQSQGKLAGPQLTALEALGAALTGRYAAGGGFAPDWHAVVWSPADPSFTDSNGVHTRMTHLITPITNHVLSENVHRRVSRAFGHGV